MIKTKLILFLFLICCNTAWASVYIEIHTQSDVISYNIASIDSISLIEPKPTYVIDAMGKEYPIGFIAGNYWMLEDLTCAVYDTLSHNRGIRLVVSSDSTEIAYKVNVFYNWQAAVGITPQFPNPVFQTTVQGICPNKFHIPSRKEWEYAKHSHARQAQFLRKRYQWHR